MNDDMRIIADYPEQDGYPAFRDAIFVSLSDYLAMSEEDKEALRLERYEAFKAHIDNPPTPEAPEAPVEGTVAQLNEMREQASALLQRIDDALAAAASEE